MNPRHVYNENVPQVILMAELILKTIFIEYSVNN